MILHPSETTLQRFATSDLAPVAREKVAVHLLKCSRCRRGLDEIRNVQTELRALADTSVPAGAWEQITARIQNGERVILPVGDATRARTRTSRLRVAVAAAIVLAAGVGVFTIVPHAGAHKSELRLTPVAPQRGAEIEVSYVPSSIFAGQVRLVVRARYRPAGQRAPSGEMTHTRVAELTRRRNGIFHGTFQLPDSVVYAVFAVESASGDRVDDNGGRLWEMFVHDDSGRPLLEALQQRMADHEGRNWEAGFETARMMTRLYPDRVQGWLALYTDELEIRSEETADSLRDFHRARFADLERAYASRENVSAEEMSDMSSYAYYLGDFDARARWEEHLLEEHPNSLSSLNRRALQRFRNDNTRFLEAIDSIWQAVGPVFEPMFIMQGIWIAQELHDPSALLRWVNRYTQVHSGWSHVGAKLLAGSWDPDLRREGMNRLRQEIQRRRMVTEDRRLLGETAEEQQRREARLARRMLAALGQGLLAEGRTQAALDTLGLAATGGWDVELFRTVADLRMAAGDTAGALRILARMAVDPGASPAFEDTVRLRAGRHFEPARWQGWTVSAREIMRHDTSLDMVSRPLGSRVRVTALDGRTRDLKELMDGRVTVVAFWNRGCGASLEQLPALQRLADQLQRQGVRVVAITDEPISAKLREFLTTRGFTLPVYQDAHGEAGRAFNQWATPHYVVVDVSGRIRFEDSKIQDIPRQVVVLQGTTGLPGN